MIGAIESGALFASVPIDNRGIINCNGKDIKRLFKDGVWLNDKIVNSVACIINYSNEASEYKSHIFNSLFFVSLCSDLGHFTASGVINFNNVGRWSKKIDKAALDI